MKTNNTAGKRVMLATAKEYALGGHCRKRGALGARAYPFGRLEKHNRM